MKNTLKYLNFFYALRIMLNLSIETWADKIAQGVDLVIFNSENRAINSEWLCQLALVCRPFRAICLVNFICDILYF